MPDLSEDLSECPSAPPDLTQGPPATICLQKLGLPILRESLCDPVEPQGPYRHCSFEDKSLSLQVLRKRVWRESQQKETRENLLPTKRLFKRFR